MPKLKSKKSCKHTSESEESASDSSSDSSSESSSSSEEDLKKKSKKSKKPQSEKRKKSKRSSSSSSDSESSSSGSSSGSESDDSSKKKKSRKRKIEEKTVKRKSEDENLARQRRRSRSPQRHGHDRSPERRLRVKEENSDRGDRRGVNDRSRWDSPERGGRDYHSDRDRRNRDRGDYGRNQRNDNWQNQRRNDYHNNSGDGRRGNFHDRDGNRDRFERHESDRFRGGDRRGGGRNDYPDNRDRDRDNRRDRDRKDDRDGHRIKDERRSRSNSPRRPRNFPRRNKDEDDGSYEWGKKGRSHSKDRGSQPPVEKEKPNFGLSGKLVEDTNKVNGIVVKYSEPLEARKPKRRWRLYPFKGEKALPTMYIHRQSCFLIGRDRKVCDLAVDHPSCSKQHAALQYRLVPFEREDGTTGKRVRPYLIDLESANGTFINNKKIEAKKYHELLEKDVIKFGFSSREYVLLHENSKEDQMDDDVLEDLQVKEEPT